MLFLGLTLVQLPYISWGAELSSDYDVRTQITSLRERVGALGSIGALTTAFIVAMFGLDTLQPVLKSMTVIIFISVPLLFLPLLYKVPAVHGPGENAEHIPFFEGVMIAFRNPVFRHFALAILLLYLGMMPGGAIGWFLFDHYFERPELFALMTLLEFAAGFVGLFFWTRLAVRISKHKAATFVMLWIAGFTALVPLIAQFGTWPTIALIVIRSFALGGMLMLPYAIFADVIDVDTAPTGRQRTGIYMAFGGIIVKLAITIGVAVALAIPGLFGFDPSVRTNSAAAEFSVLGTYGWMGAVFWLLAAPLFWRFPLTREKVAETQQQIARQAASN